MNFRFSLQTVLRHRKNIENLAVKDFKEKLFEVHQAEESLIVLENQVKEAHQKAFEIQSQGGSAGPALGQVDEFMKGQALRIERQKERIQGLQAQVEKLREILRLKAIDYKIIDKLRENKKEDFRKQQNKIEQKTLDEMNVMRFKKKVL